MAAGASLTTIGADYTPNDWGIPDEQFGFIATQSVSLTNSVTLVEAKNRVGEVVCVLTYDKRSEVTVDGIGKPQGDGGTWGTDIDLGKMLTLSDMDDYILPDSTAVICTEASVNFANEDWQKFSIKGTLYELITDSSTETSGQDSG